MAADSDLDSDELRDLIARTRAGERAAEERLVKAIFVRFQRLARRMLKNYPLVRQWEQTGDIVNEALPRLLGALRKVSPATKRDFFNLAAEQIRRQLINLARRHRRRVLAPPPNGNDSSVEPNHPPDPCPPVDDLERWQHFHEAVARLPPEDREVFMLTYYHGWSKPRIAELFRVDERTIRRRWRAAIEALDQELGGRLPGQ